MFRRAHHQRIARVLESLDAELLAEHQCWFGGGTALALAYDEYRESVDIDFLVSDRAGYRGLRELVGEQGMTALTTQHVDLEREVTATAYGIRTHLLVDGVGIKFEIIVEGNLELEVPGSGGGICGLDTLTPVDQVATKLLANSDRWPDRSTFSRDLIDLAFIRADDEAIHAGFAKAERAYGRAVRDGLSKSRQLLMDNPGRLEELVETLQIQVAPGIAATPAQVWSRIKRFEKVVASWADQ